MAEKPTLSQLALFVRNAAPEAWENFVRAVEGYAYSVAAQMTYAPTEELPIAQGRAQAILALLDILKNCHVERKKPTPPNE